MSEIWSDEFICPTCGEDLEEWEEHIYECKECGTMIDVEIFEVVEAEEIEKEHESGGSDER